jgi:hypothetical protein
MMNFLWTDDEVNKELAELQSVLEFISVNAILWSKMRWFPKNIS